MKRNDNRRQSARGDEPIARAEDVEFSAEWADEEDREAERRAAEADARALRYEGDRS